MAAIVAVSPVASARQTPALSVQDAVDRYAGGDFDAAVRSLDTRALKVAPFTRALDTWIATGDAAAQSRRRLVAAAFALDTTWVATRTDWWVTWRVNGEPRNRIPPVHPDRESLDNFTAQALVARWAIQQLPATGAAGDLERSLWLTAVGVAEDGSGWVRLKNEILPPAKKRLPGEPRLLLAEVLASTNLELGALRSFSLQTRDILRRERVAPSGSIGPAIRAFEPLLGNPALACEVELRIGYLELRRNQWADALARFDAARSKTGESVLRAIADYFAGWVLEQMERPDEAIVAYRRALAIAPTMRNLATRLSALLYLRNERNDAYAVLDTALNARPAPLDLMVTLERADARSVPEWIESIRKALK